MRSFQLILILVFIVQLNLASQNNLQFSQVVIVSETNQTVPTGKVWKIETYLQKQVVISNQGSGNCTNTASWLRPFYIDESPYYSIIGIGYGAGNETFRAAPANPFPIWLKSNQTIRTSCSGDILSVLEFNITE